jgi:hypothetical protein
MPTNVIIRMTWIAIRFILLLSLVAAPLQLPKAQAAPTAVDLRQAGPIRVSGDLVEGGRVYLEIPVRNYGSTASGPVHAYSEGYTSQGNLWRADGAQPTAVVIGPNQTITFRVQHDLWYGHLGVWRTVGVYLWNDANHSYYGALPPNGYSQVVNFAVTLDIRQASPIQVSGNLLEGGRVYLTFAVRNHSSQASPALHPYVEGRTTLGNLWRADGAQPTAVVLQPGQTTTFRVEHDLWAGHGGTWNTTGVFLWNDANNTYYNPLVANGYDQQISFAVALPADIRQNGPIQIGGSSVEGGRVLLSIPIRNAGGTTSPPLHVYTEGATGAGSLWRADGAQPTAVVLQPGQTTTIQVRHDLWYGHAGTWRTDGAFLWNDETNSYLGPLITNGYSQQLAFEVSEQRLRSLDVQYLDDSNRAVELTYEVVSENTDGSLTVNLTVHSKTLIPYMWDVSNLGLVDNPQGSLQQLDNKAFMVLLGKTNKTFYNVRFPADSQLQFRFPKYGYTDQQSDWMFLIHLTNVLAADVYGTVPSAEQLRTYDYLMLEGSQLLIDTAARFPLDVFALVPDLMQGDVLGLLTTLVGWADEHSDKFFDAARAILVSPPTRTAIQGAITTGHLVLHFFDFVTYFHDLASTPRYAQVTIRPSSRPATSGAVQATQALMAPAVAATSLPLSVVAVSSAQGPGWSPAWAVDGDEATAWASSGETVAGEWLRLRLVGGAPALVTELTLAAGAGGGDHAGAALTDFRLETSLDGLAFTPVLTGTVGGGPGEVQVFDFSPQPARYLRLVALGNQSGNLVRYVNVAEVGVGGLPYAPDDAYEPDSQAAQANWLGVPTVNQAHSFSYAGDEDWLRFEADAGHRYWLTLRAANGEVGQHKLSILDADGVLIATATTGAGGWARLALTPDGAATYLVQVEAPVPGAFGLATAYQLALVDATHVGYLPFLGRP